MPALQLTHTHTARATEGKKLNIMVYIDIIMYTSVLIIMEKYLNTHNIQKCMSSP